MKFERCILKVFLYVEHKIWTLYIESILYIENKVWTLYSESILKGHVVH